MKKNSILKTFQNIAAIVIVFLFSDFIAKSQSFEWAKKIGSSSNDSGNAITTDEEGNVYVTGSFEGTVDFNPSAATFNLTSFGVQDIFVTKFNNSGTFIWAKQFGGSGYDSGNSITVDAIGNVYTAGSFSDNSDFDPSENFFNIAYIGTFLSKLDPEGNFIWAKSIDFFSPGESITISLNGSNSIYLMGKYGYEGDLDPGEDVYNLNYGGVYLEKLDTDGNFLWAKQILNDYYTQNYDFTIDQNGFIYVTGEFTGNQDFDPGDSVFTLYTIDESSYDIFVLKLDSEGNFIWAKNFGGNALNYVKSIATDANGDVYITGYFFITADFDPGPLEFNLTSYGDNTFVLKLNQNGDFIWAKQIEGYLSNISKSIKVDIVGNTYTIGYFVGEVDFDPNEGVYSLTANGENDIFVLKLDTDGNFVWAKQFGGDSYNYRSDIKVDSDGSIYTTGSFNGTVDFDPNEDLFNLSSSGFGGDVFIHKMSNSIIGLPEQSTLKTSFNIYPNPNNGEFTTMSRTPGEFIIVNQLGQKINTFYLNISNDYTATIDGLANGIYCISGKTTDGTVREKIVVAK
jgi:Beta-propeller repeat/Secretion system C-terminal sorting domain